MTSKLIVDGQTYHSTWEVSRKKEAQKVIQNWREYGKILVMRNYGVSIHTVDPKTNNVIHWDKSKGYSLWG